MSTKEHGNRFWMSWFHLLTLLILCATLVFKLDYIAHTLIDILKNVSNGDRSTKERGQMESSKINASDDDGEE
ncbi:hypothetical protein OROGR_013516 [Orobanche gracilis]